MSGNWRRRARAATRMREYEVETKSETLKLLEAGIDNVMEDEARIAVDR